MLELDSPGHTAAWGGGTPGLLTPCANNSFGVGPIDPTKASRTALTRTGVGRHASRKERKTYARCQACVKGALARKAPPRASCIT
jgi:hypothetical protein